VFEDNNQTRLTTLKKFEELITVEQDVVVEEKKPIKEEHNADKEEKKSNIEENGVASVVEQTDKEEQNCIAETTYHGQKTSSVAM